MIRAIFVLLLLSSCGSETVTPSEEVGDSGPDVSAAGTCASYQGWVTDAIRGLPRECSSPSDCMVVERAGNCECAIAATLGGDLAGLNTALQTLDEQNCSHPFACMGSMSACSYQSPFDAKELVVTCEENVCGLIEVMACDTYAERKNGGLYPAGACMEDDDCELRDDLNPCGCQESYPASFPFILAMDAVTLMQQNESRCAFTCSACPVVSEAFCDAGKCSAR